MAKLLINDYSRHLKARQSKPNKENMMNKLKQLLTIISGLTLAFAALSNQQISTETANSGAINYYYVGADNTCNFSTIESALIAASNSQNAVEIRIADNKNYHEFITIDLNNVLIDGNYANCADARKNITGGNRAKLLGFLGTNLPLIRINGLFVHIKDMQLQGNGGGGIIANSTSVITLEDMLFFQLGNPGLQTSGSGQIDVRIKNSVFLLNTAHFGAAINCTGLNHSIEVTEGSGFASNTATGTGGAVNLEFCEFSMIGGGFQNNISASSGGAMKSIDSDIILKNVTFTGNESDFLGGAISARGTFIQAENTKFIRNEASTGGGAIDIRDGAVFNSKRNPTSCLSNQKCNHFDGNKAGYGGAVSIARGSIIIEGTFFENNRADKGTVLRAFDGSEVTVEGSVFNHNGNQAADGFDDLSVISLNSDSETTLKYSTFADNQVLFSTFNQVDHAVLNIYSSIIYDPDSGVVFGATGSNSTLNPSCLILHEEDSANIINVNISVVDPMFVDPANGDYHISATSPAIDYCTDSLTMAQFPDIDNQARGYDDPTVPNSNGTYDIGADEVHDLIFANGFE